MPTAIVNSIRLAYEISGHGDIPLVLVHGSWVSRRSWDLVVPRLAESFRVVTYDRRGHSESERPTTQGSVHEDAADLAALIEHLRLGPAWVVGNSFGASIALRLACTQPALLRGVIAHEPPLFALLVNDSAVASVLKTLRAGTSSVVQRIAAGDHSGAAEQFVDTLALGPGAWAGLPRHAQQTCIENAPTFLDESNDPDQYGFDLHGITTFPRPVLLSTGDRSLPAYGLVLEQLAQVVPSADVFTFHGAGHIPHATHPDTYVAVITDFIRKHER
jgi:pimeloyl-ACP methyl ester carboxylesterase